MDRGVIEAVKERYDLRLLYPFTGDHKPASGGRYFADHCPAGTHADRTPSFLVFKDGARCMACGYMLDVISLTMQSRRLNFVRAVEELDGGHAPDFGSRYADRVRLTLNERQEPAAPLSLGDLEQFRRIEPADLRVPGLAALDVGVAREFGLRAVGNGLIAVPVWIDGQLANIRLYNPGRAVAGVPKWIVYDKGRGKQLYNSDGVGPGMAVVILEGEKGCWFAEQVGLRGVAAQGATSFNAAMIRRLDAVDPDRLFVCGDKDLAGRRFNVRVSALLHSAMPVWWSHVGWDVLLCQGFDMADFVTAGGTADEFMEVAERSRLGAYPQAGGDEL